jgi:hypothetical protein
MELKKYQRKYTRTFTKKCSDAMFIFTDNCDRTSGKGEIPDDSEYSKRFGKTGLCYPSTTSALIRGLDNAYPITTQKRFFPGSKRFNGNWTDDDFEEFKKVIDDDFEHIKKACKEKGYKTIYFPQRGILNSAISRITFERTPKLFKYIIEKEIELKNFEI